jgi:cytochrome b561
MSTENVQTTPRRPGAVIFLHWLTLVALLGAVLLVLVRDEFDGRELRYWLLEAHRYLGLLVFALLFARLVTRYRHRLAILVESSRLATLAASLIHCALYVLLATVPLLGWTTSNALGQDVHFLGVALPALIAPDDDLGDRLQQWHQTAAWSLVALAAIHALAALWHHFIRRDAVLAAMLPRRVRRQTNQ